MTQNNAVTKKEKFTDTSRYRRMGTFSAVLALAIFGVVLTTSSVGAQTILCDGKPATIIGTSGDDRLVGTIGDDVIVGLQGNDTISGISGDDTICGGKGDDILRGGKGFDVIFGAQGDDEIYAESGSVLVQREDERGARMFGGAGDDEIHGSNKWDRMQGGPGNDMLYGYEGRDWIRAGGDNDIVSGGVGIDDLHGGNGSDRIAVTGNDVVRGGAGIDMCVISGAAELLRSCGQNRPEPSAQDGRISFTAGTYLTPREVPYGLYRTTRYWETTADNRIVQNDASGIDGTTVAVVDKRASRVEFRTPARKVDAQTPRVNPFNFTSGRFIVGLDLAPGTYRVSAIDEFRPNIAVYDPTGRLVDIELAEGSVIIEVTPDHGVVDFRGRLERL